jgi:adenosine deaminase
LNEEYKQLHNTLGWEKENYYRCNVNALQAAFIPDELRSQLLARLADGYQQDI